MQMTCCCWLASHMFARSPRGSLFLAHRLGFASGISRWAVARANSDSCSVFAALFDPILLRHIISAWIGYEYHVICSCSEYLLLQRGRYGCGGVQLKVHGE